MIGGGTLGREPHVRHETPRFCHAARRRGGRRGRLGRVPSRASGCAEPAYSCRQQRLIRERGPGRGLPAGAWRIGLEQRP